jgi:hypothetical protein
MGISEPLKEANEVENVVTVVRRPVVIAPAAID